MPGILCEHCTAVCCRYVALPIDKPRTRAEFDDVRWYLLHEGLSVFVEEGDWYIAFQTACRHLLPDHRCGIYETRPNICRKYTTDNCDYHSGDYGWEHHFTCPEHLDAYVAEHGPRGRGRTTRAKHQHSRLRAKLPSDRPMAAGATHTHDLRGVPLPVLPMLRSTQ